MPSGSGGGRPWASPTARSMAICATRSGTITGTGWWPTGVGFDEFRATFGDERQDYGEALKIHYARNLTDRWGDSYVSAYARAHPWEDFAETWAHYLHIVDTLETAAAFRIRIDPHAA